MDASADLQREELLYDKAVTLAIENGRKTAEAEFSPIAGRDCASTGERKSRRRALSAGRERVTVSASGIATFALLP
ncbi:MAG TPA: hypothetical protein VIO32_09995 [Candidatus Baltobacteraceae bacterium]